MVPGGAAAGHSLPAGGPSRWLAEVCVECLIGKQKKPILFKPEVTEPSSESIPYRAPSACAKMTAYPDPPPVILLPKRPSVCVECLIGKQKKPILFKVTEPSSIPYRTHPACAKMAAYPDTVNLNFELASEGQARDSESETILRLRLS